MVGAGSGAEQEFVDVLTTSSINVTLHPERLWVGHIEPSDLQVCVIGLPLAPADCSSGVHAAMCAGGQWPELTSIVHAPGLRADPLSSRPVHPSASGELVASPQVHAWCPW